MTGLDPQVMQMAPQRLLQSMRTQPVAMTGFVNIAGVKSGRALGRKKQEKQLLLLGAACGFRGVAGGVTDIACVFRNMVIFRNVVDGEPFSNWWDNGSNQVAFGRGNKGFIIFNNDDW